MEIQFTPGPWFVSISPAQLTTHSNEILYKHVKNKESIGGNIIAKCLHKNIDKLEANAKLISAAPDLFEAAFDAQNFIMNSGDISPQALDVIDKLQQAIFKAIK